MLSHLPRRSHSKWLSLPCHLSILAALVLASCKAAPQPISEEAVANIDSVYADLAQQHVFSGVVLIAQGDEVLLSKGYGMADAESETPNTPSTRFNIGSIIIPFAATAVMILQDQGKLDIDDPICEYLPPCEPAIQPILVRHLLSQSSGLAGGHYVPGDGGRWLALDSAIYYGAGERFEISEMEYEYVPYLIERASGNSFEAFLREAIFEPLKMANTGFVNGDNGLATGYLAFGEDAGRVEAGASWMGAFIYSSADDLLTWIRALHAGQIMSQDALDEMFSPGIHVFGEGKESVSFGLGWWQGERNGHPVSAHAGMVPGFRCSVEYFSEDNAAVIVLSNLYHEESDFALAGEMLFPAR